jgi:hypothetical protein
VATPELFPEVRDLLEQHAGTEALQPLHDLADTLWQVTENPEVAMVACPLPGAYRQFPLHGNLAEEIADLETCTGFRSLRDPAQVALGRGLTLRPTPVAWHATICLPRDSPEGEEVLPPLRWRLTSESLDEEGL